MHPSLRSLAPNVFGVQLYQNNACVLLSRILSIINSDWLQHARSVHRVYEFKICDALQPNRDKSHRPILRYEQLNLAFGWKITHLSVLRFLFWFLHTLICFMSLPCNFWLIFKHFLILKKNAFSAAGLIQNCGHRKSLRPISQNHTSREAADSLIQKWSYL